MGERSSTHADWHIDEQTHDLVFSGRLQVANIAKMNLSAFDRALISEPIRDAADLFHLLELIFRRIAQQAGGEGIRLQIPTIAAELARQTRNT